MAPNKSVFADMPDLKAQKGLAHKSRYLQIAILVSSVVIMIDSVNRTNRSEYMAGIGVAIFGLALTLTCCCLFGDPKKGATDTPLLPTTVTPGRPA